MDAEERLQRLHARLGIPADYAARSRMPRIAEAAETVVVGRRRDGREHRLAPLAAAAWSTLQAAAERDGVRLWLLSGFRSFEYQADLIERKLAAGCRLADILRVVAAPGFSEHHSGHAVDMGTPGCEPLSEAFGDTPAFKWLERNAQRHGFYLSYPEANGYGIVYEPWHWALTPVPTLD